MKSNYVWYLSNGDALEGKEAFQYLNRKLQTYEKLMNDMNIVLNRSIENNKMVREKSLPNTVINTIETLSIIQIELEMLVKEMALILEND